MSTTQTTNTNKNTNKKYSLDSGEYLISSIKNDISYETNYNNIQLNGYSKVRRLRNDTGTDQCNESQIHSNMQKSVFHGMKSAKRLKDEGLHMQAVRVAGEVARGFLLAEDIIYDPKKSEKHLVERIKDKVLGGNKFDEIDKGIEKAWSKIDSGNHKGGARVAIAVADEYLDNFDTTEIEE